MAQPTWVTPAGNFGTFTEGVPILETFVATPSTGGWTLDYTILNGVFPDATVPFSLNPSTGVLTGTAAQVATTTEYSFTIRVYQYNGPSMEGFTDRTFSFFIQGITAPAFTTSAGALYPGPTFLPDSTWDPFQIGYTNPDPGTTAVVRVVDGTLPPGIEMDESGLIRGYADPSNTNYPFTLEVSSGSGSATRNFSIQVVDQTAPLRAPAILNTQPPSFTIPDNDPNKPYYLDSAGNIGTVSQGNYFIFKIIGDGFNSGNLSYIRGGTLPPGITDNTGYSSSNVQVTILNGGGGYAPGDQLFIDGADLGGASVINDLSFTVDTVSGSTLTGVTGFNGLNVESLEIYTPVTIQTGTGIGAGAIATVTKINPCWIMGNITVNPALTVATYNFDYYVGNVSNLLTSSTINFSVTVVAQDNNVPFDTAINWNTPENLGTIFNGSISSLNVQAVQAGGLELQYSVTSGSLPPDLTLDSNGDIVGRVAFETQGTVTPQGTSIDYTFTVEAQSILYPILTSSRTFTLTVYQKFDEPYDNIYIKAYLPVDERMILNSLLQDAYIFNPDYLYRPDDPYFGKSVDVVYQHMFGVPSSTIDTYIAAVQKNHYRRNITLGPIKTAIARDSVGNVQYEVVYSEIIDELVNPEGVSINKQITWPVPLGGASRVLYPASLENMRLQVQDSIGQETDSSLLPTWMTSQQEDGTILGFVPAWVICYTKPGYAEIIKNNIITPFSGPFIATATSSTDDTITCQTTAGFYPGMKVEFSGTTFGGITAGVQYLVYSIESETKFTITTSMLTGPVPLSTATGVMEFTHITWDYTLNILDFRIDRFEVSKAITYEYDPSTDTWSALPSSVDQTNSNDVYVYYKKNILSST